MSECDHGVSLFKRCEQCDGAEPKPPQGLIKVGGALTANRLTDYWQIPWEMLDAYARRCYEGQHPSSGREPYPLQNWRDGLSSPAYIRARHSSLMRHVAKLGNGLKADGDGFQGHIDAIVWAAGFLATAYARHPQAVEAAFYSEGRGEKPE